PKQRQPASSMVLKRVKRRSYRTRFRTRSRKDGETAYRRRLSVSSGHSCLRPRREPNNVGTETTQSIEDSVQSCSREENSNEKGSDYLHGPGSTGINNSERA